MYNNEPFNLTAGLCAAKTWVAFHPLPRGFIDVDQPKMCMSPLPLPYLSRNNNTADSHTLTHCVLDNNGASSYSIWAQAGLGRGLPRCPSETPSKRGRQSPFIHVFIRRWLCRGNMLCKQWLTILSTHLKEYCIELAHFRWCVEALSLFLSFFLSLSFVLTGSSIVFCNVLCRWIGSGLRVPVQKIAGVAWACALLMLSDCLKMLCNGPFSKKKNPKARGICEFTNTSRLVSVDNFILFSSGILFAIQVWKSTLSAGWCRTVENPKLCWQCWFCI